MDFFHIKKIVSFARKNLGTGNLQSMEKGRKIRSASGGNYREGKGIKIKEPREGKDAPGKIPSIME